MKRKSSNGLPSKYLLTIMAIICVMLLFISYSTGFTSGPVGVISNYLFIPMQKGIDFIGNSIAISSADTKTKEQLVAENEELTKQIEELNAQMDKMQYQMDELVTLQKLYKLDSNYTDYETVGARIIASGTSNWFNSFTINKGSKDGIKVNMNVIADEGLVGIVTDVGENYANVRCIIDDTANTSGMIISTNDNCIISGSLESMISDKTISFSNLNDENDKVAIGDMVVTSNISDKYLPGLLIGYVASVLPDDNELTKSGTVTPVVDFKHLSDVLVIMQLKETYDE